MAQGTPPAAVQARAYAPTCVALCTSSEIAGPPSFPGWQRDHFWDAVGATRRGVCARRPARVRRRPIWQQGRPRRLAPARCSGGRGHARGERGVPPLRGGDPRCAMVASLTSSKLHDGVRACMAAMQRPRVLRNMPLRRRPSVFLPRRLPSTRAWGTASPSSAASASATGTSCSSTTPRRPRSTESAHSKFAAHSVSRVRAKFASSRVAGLSLYPAYLAPHPSSRPASALENIDALASLARRFPGKRVYIAETAYPQRGTAPPPHRFAASPLGQYEYLRAVLSRLAQALPEAQRGGVLWWERNESCDDALFSPSGVASPALLHGFVHGRLPRRVALRKTLL